MIQEQAGHRRSKFVFHTKMIRALELRDLPRVKELQADFAWEFGTDFMGALVLVDEQDVPQLIVGSWRRAEVHMLMCSTWNTPQGRLKALREIHDAMERELAILGVGEVHTFMDQKDKRFTKRLCGLGWIQCLKQVWVRRVNV